MVNDFDACPSHAEITAIGKSCRCISVPHVCRASWNRMWRTPAAVALREFDTFDLRRQLAPFNHRIRLAKEAAASHDAASVCAAMNRSISDDVTRRDAPI